MLAVMLAKLLTSDITELNEAVANFSKTSTFINSVRFIISQDLPTRYKVTGEISKIEAESEIFLKEANQNGQLIANDKKSIVSILY